MKTALVLGAGGFIGSHMVAQLKHEGYWVRGVDLKRPEFSASQADHFVIRDLRDPRDMAELVGWAGCNRNPYETFALQFDQPFDEIYQFAADMGGAGYIFTGDNDAHIMHNSAMINLNLLDAVVKHHGETKPRIFYSSSACIYPEHNQLDPDNPNCEESSAYPANPDSEYGWEKLFSERLYLAYAKNHNLQVCIGRYHNIYGPEGTFQGGREKAPAAICRKVAESQDGIIEIWGDGTQTRSFLYIDACIAATRRLMESGYSQPVNIGSTQMVTINRLVELASQAADKNVIIHNVEGPTGVRGRNSHNELYELVTGSMIEYPLEEGIMNTYVWIRDQLQKSQ
jgi:nucleoside-diphosphate-sugar epimerase